VFFACCVIASHDGFWYKQISIVYFEVPDLEFSINFAIGKN